MVKNWWMPWIIATVSIAVILLICMALAAQAAPSYQATEQVPGIVSYQGQVDIGGIPFSGTGYFRFAIIDSGETFYWSNDGSIVTPTDAITLSVVNGLFNAILGETNPITYGMFLDSDRWLRVWFDDGVHGNQLLEPDTRITSALFAFRADESMTAITSTWSTTATYAFDAITSTIASTATFAWKSASSDYSSVGTYAWGATHWTTGTLTDVIAYHTFTELVNMTHTLATNALTATNATTATYATTALTATNATTATYATTAGSATTALTDDSTALGCRVYRSTQQTITNSVSISLTFDTEVSDTNSCWSNANPTRFYATTAGYYMAGCQIFWTTTFTQPYVIIIKQNTGLQLAENGYDSGANYIRIQGITTGMFYMNANDYVEFLVYHEASAAKLLTAATTTDHRGNSGWLIRIP
jgi:hypothetical protein